MKTISSEQKPNLTIMDNSIVHKLIIEDKKCVGVKVGNSNRLRKSQKSTDIFANGEVVLSAGAFISPALLQLRFIFKIDKCAIFKITPLVVILKSNFDLF